MGRVRDVADLVEMIGLGERSVEVELLVAFAVGSAGTKKVAEAVARGVDE